MFFFVSIFFAGIVHISVHSMPVCIWLYAGHVYGIPILYFICLDIYSEPFLL